MSIYRPFVDDILILCVNFDTCNYQTNGSQKGLGANDGCIKQQTNRAVTAIFGNHRSIMKSWE
jgi:hypothetical protein